MASKRSKAKRRTKSTAGSKKKSVSKKRSSTKIGSLERKALASGRTIAKDALTTRAAQQAVRTQRQASVQRMQRRARPTAMAVPATRIPAKTTRLLGPKATSGVLIAEGDSWFDYPGLDILSCLEDEYLFDVESVARKGHCLEDMAYTGGQFEDFARKLEKLLREQTVPRAILLSGGGNDIAGDEFALLLNHAASSLTPLNGDIVKGVVDVRLRAAYLSMIGGLTDIAKSYLNRPIPIIMHGYGYAVPDGRGFLGGFSLLPGPWLEPGFRNKGWPSLNDNKKVIGDLIDRFNSMLQGVSAIPQLGHVYYVDLRNCLRDDAKYKNDWANELHPTRSGFRTVTKKFAELIMTL